MSKLVRLKTYLTQHKTINYLLIAKCLSVGVSLNLNSCYLGLGEGGMEEMFRVQICNQ